MSLTFNNKIALITGAGRGIGKAIALKLAAAGVKAICVSKSASCEEVAQAIMASGGQAVAFQVDVADKAAVQAACTKILEEHGSVDILVNNAGITRDNLVLRMSYEEWDEVIATNLSSAFYWIKSLIRNMTSNRWGRIINISSVTGVMGNAGQVNYGAAKAGLLGLTKCLAREVASRNITVNAVAPGFITTDMTKDLGEAIQEQIKKTVPLKRFGEADDVANTVLFLSSEEAGYITGQTLSVDGGMAM